MAWLASEQPTKSYHFFLTSHQCQVPSLFPNTYNFVLQTFTPAKISHHKWLSMKIQAILFVQICNQRICVTSYSVPFSPSESLPVSPSSTISMFFSWMSQRTAGTAAAAVFLLLFSLQKCRFFNLACLVNRMRSPQYSSKHFGSSCAIRFRTFQGSLQISFPVKQSFPVMNTFHFTMPWYLHDVLQLWQLWAPTSMPQPAKKCPKPRSWEVLKSVKVKWSRPSRKVQPKKR